MEQAIRIYPHNCTQQQQDFIRLEESVDTLAAASLALASQGAHAYQQFIDARQNFTQLVRAMGKNYRYVEI
jgi:hypothetical protein